MHGRANDSSPTRPVDSLGQTEIALFGQPLPVHSVGGLRKMQNTPASPQDGDCMSPWTPPGRQYNYSLTPPELTKAARSPHARQPSLEFPFFRPEQQDSIEIRDDLQEPSLDLHLRSLASFGMAEIGGSWSFTSVKDSVLDGRWVHKHSPGQVEVIEYGTVRSQDGTIMELSFKAGTNQLVKEANCSKMLGHLEPDGSIVWQNGSVWLYEMPEVQQPRTTTGSQQLSARREEQAAEKPRRMLPRGHSSERTDLPTLPHELRMLMRMPPPPPKWRQPARAEGEVFQDSAPCPAVSARAKQSSTAVQCTDLFRDVEDAQTLSSREASAEVAQEHQRWLLVHRCNPAVVDLKGWTQLMSTQTKPSDRELYCSRFQQQFPGCMDSPELANKAGGQSLAQEAALKIVQRFVAGTRQPVPSHWR